MSTIWDSLSGIIMAVMEALPLGLVKVLFIGLFIGLAVWAVTLSADYIYQGSEDRPRWKDVRIWAAVVIGLEVIPYLVF